MAIDGTPENDSLPGTAGADEINGFEGDDTIAGGGGADTLNGGDGNDHIAVMGEATASGGSGSDRYEVAFVGAHRFFRVTDFAVGAGGDVISLESIVAASTGLAAGNPFDPALGYARLVVSNEIGINDYIGPAALLQWDPDGAQGGSGWVFQLLLNSDEARGITADNLFVGEDVTLDVVATLVTEPSVASGSNTYDAITAAIDYSLESLGSISGLSLTGSGIRATGNGLKNVLKGNALANVMDGRSGHDSLWGREGDDHLLGGDGNDYLDGDAGNDTLDGGADEFESPLIMGATQGDSLVGGAGDDTYLVNSALDTVKEQEDEGTDTVRATVNETLDAHVEHLMLTGGANRNGTGNGLGNRLTGNGGKNLLSGLGGDDTLDGGRGNDTLTGGSDHDILVWGSGDKVNGGSGIDMLKATGTLDLRMVGDRDILGIEQVDMRGGGGRTLTITRADVLAMNSNDLVKILGDDNDRIVASGFRQISDFRGFDRYRNGAATLLVGPQVDVTE